MKARYRRGHLIARIILIVLFLEIQPISSAAWVFDDDTSDNENYRANDHHLDQESLDLDLESKVKKGEESYHHLRQQSQFYGDCWLNAMESLHVGCRALTDDVQARLGLSFTNCYLEKMGLTTYPCPLSDTIKECVKGMNDRSFQAYTNFFTHTQSVCFFLSSQLWQRRTQETIGKLSMIAGKVSEKLGEMKSLQEESIETQRSLNRELSGSQLVLENLEKTLSAKQTIEYEILTRLIDVRDYVITEVTKFYSVAFYLVSLIVIYLLTTPVRTAEARFWLFLLLCFNFVAERFIVSSVISEDSGVFHHLNVLSSSIDDQTWLIRKATIIICGIVLGYFATTYKDYGVINHQLLTDIRQQNEEIKRLHFLSLRRLADQYDCQQDLAKTNSSKPKSTTISDSNDSSDEDYESEPTSDLDSSISESEVKDLKSDVKKQIIVSQRSMKTITEEADITSTSGDEENLNSLNEDLNAPHGTVSTGGRSKSEVSNLVSDQDLSISETYTVGRYGLRPRKSTTPTSPIAVVVNNISEPSVTFTRCVRRSSTSSRTPSNSGKRLLAITNKSTTFAGGLPSSDDDIVG